MKKKIYIVIFIISLIVFIVSACTVAFLLRRDSDFDDVRESIEQLTSEPSESDSGDKPTDKEEPTEPSFADNPVNFAEWQEINPDIYAWIQVPGTPIDYPIVQRADEELYYLRRDYKGDYYYPGCIFTQYFNKKDFSDPNTLIYGHQTFNGTFFGPLHDFQDRDFFDKNDTVIIYTENRKLTYRIFAAYQYDSRHILKAFDFSNKNVFAQYISSCLNPDSLLQNVRKDVKVTENDKIITLSTCMPSGAKDQRYLVQGVLVNDEPTK